MTFPDSSEAMAAQLADAVAKTLHLDRARERIRVEGDAWPEVGRVAIDLSGGQVDLDAPPPQSKIVRDREPGPRARELTVVANPLRFGNATLQTDLRATDARFDFGRDGQGRPVVSLVDAAEGSLHVRTTLRDLESMIATGASHAAAAQGVIIEGVRLELRGDGPRHLHGTAHVTARKGSGLFSARTTLRLTGQVRFDDQLHARVSDLDIHGSGLIGGIAGALLRPHLHRLEGRTFSINALALDELKLHDVRIETTPEVMLSARFGQ